MSLWCSIFFTCRWRPSRSSMALLLYPSPDRDLSTSEMPCTLFQLLAERGFSGQTEPRRRGSEQFHLGQLYDDSVWTWAWTWLVLSEATPLIIKGCAHFTQSHYCNFFIFPLKCFFIYIYIYKNSITFFRWCNFTLRAGKKFGHDLS